MQDPEYRAGWDAIQLNWHIVFALTDARAQSGLTQAEVALQMGTTQSVVARMEGARVLPSLRSIERYAAAVGARLDLRLVRG